MSEHFLSQLHIQKLGHPLDEIRIRALSSIISKYNLNLVDENNMANTKLLVDKLFEWFTFDRIPEEKKVISLIQRVLNHENGYKIIQDIGGSVLRKKINDLDKRTGYRNSSQLEDLRVFIDKLENIPSNRVSSCEYVKSQTTAQSKVTLYMTNQQHNNNNNNYDDGIKCKYEYNSDYNLNIKKPITETYSNRNGEQYKTELNTLDIPRTCLTSSNESHSSCFKIELFPWQTLVSNDKQVLTSVFDGLKYIDDKYSIQQSCQFFIEVVLRDFPPEVFIQRPLILRTFLQLLNSVETDLRVPILKCLLKLVQCLKSKICLSLNPVLFNRKKEFYTSSVYPDENSESIDSEDNKFSKKFNLSFTASFDDDSCCNGESVNDIHKLKKYQLTLPEVCLEIISKCFPALKKQCSPEELNQLMEIIYESLTCVVINLKPDVWQHLNGLKDKFYKIFGLIQDVLRQYRKQNLIVHVILLNYVIKILNLLNPPTGLDLNDVLPKSLQQELGNCVFNSSLYLMFPQLHSELLKYAQEFIGQEEREIYQDYKDVQLVLNAMKSSITFMKARSKFKTKMEKLECVYESLPSLHFHECHQLIQAFVSCCLLKWSKSQLREKELKLREQILLKLLSSSNSNVKLCIYREINELAVQLLGEKEAVHPTYEFPGDKMEFLFHVDVLTELICHGLNSELHQVGEFSNNILINLLKSKFIMSDSCWSDFMAVLSPCICLLECYAEKSTPLGRCVIKMFDPDVARVNGLPELELIKGNIRLLFSKNSLTRDEAISRLFWLLNQEDLEDKKLPKMSVLTRLNLSPICVSVKAEEYTTFQKSFYNPGKLCDVLEMLASQNLEPNIRRSALSQLSVMMEDVLLHSTFLEQKGLQIMVKILDNSLVESDYRNYPDSVMPVIDILKQLSLHNAFVCQELGSNTQVFYNVLRSLFLFSNDERLRRNAVELLCLLLYSDCTLRVPSDKSSRRMISFPDLVISKMSVPFVCNVHWKNSKNFEVSVKKTILGKENCSKLIRIFWAVQWTASLTELLAMTESDINVKARSPGIPEDMIISYEDIEELRECSFGISVKHLLFDIQNASTHEVVCQSLHKLDSYLLLYNVDKVTQSKSSGSDVINENVLSHMLWESTLERFMLSTPTCLKDETLLLLVVRFVQKLMRSFKSERLTCWIEKFLNDVHKPLFKILRGLGKNNSGLKGRELRLSIIELLQQVITTKSSLDPHKWFSYLELISDLLKLDKKGCEFYNVAYVDWLIGLLADLTRKCSLADKPEYVKNLIIRIMEIIIAFHCTPDSAVSFMGLNIIKNSIFVLNHILMDTKTNGENWEDMWFEAVSKVIGHVNNINYCWLLSLWFTRDPILRAASLQLFAGFSSTVKGCELLLDKMNVPFKHVWTEGFKILFDEKECCCVRENCGLMLSNLTILNNKLSSGGLLESLNRQQFYLKMLEIVQNYQPDCTYYELSLDESTNTFKGEVVSMPTLINSITALLHNVISLDYNSVCEKIMESGILECLIRVLGEVPEGTSVCKQHQKSVDILKMYITVCRLFVRCATSNSTAHSLLLQSHNLFNHLFCMINYNLYCKTSKTVNCLKNELWIEVFDLFTALLADEPKNLGQGDEHSAFLDLNRCMTENGVDHFVSSLYIALTSESSALRASIQHFLINLFHHEIAMRKHVSLSDIFDRIISEKSIERSKDHGSRELDIPENVKLDFGIRLADALLQIVYLGFEGAMESTKTVAAKALASLFVVHSSSQNFCVEHNFGGFVLSHLKKICVKLNLENAGGSFKKMSERKKLEPVLKDIETLYELTSNFMYNNEAAKMDLSHRGLPVLVHKLWPWSGMKPSLQIVALKMLCTFSHSFPQGCRSFVVSSNITVLSMKKMPGSVTLMNVIVNHITFEMDTLSKTNTCEMLRLCLQLLSNSCCVTECRTVLSKGNIFQSFLKLKTNRKKRVYGDDVVDSWLTFLIAFSSHQEGQLALTKNQDVLDFILSMATTSPKFDQKVNSLRVLRNLCFHQLNRYRMLNWCNFLTLLQDALTSGRRNEVQHAANAIWALACNSQKDKLILRSAGFEEKLEIAKRQSAVNEDPETGELATTVLNVLRNK